MERNVGSTMTTYERGDGDDWWGEYTFITDEPDIDHASDEFDVEVIEVVWTATAVRKFILNPTPPDEDGE